MVPMSDPKVLGEKESRFVSRIQRNQKLYLAFSLLGIAAAAALTGRLLWHHEFTKLHAVLVVLIFLQARGNLRMHKVAKILIKLQNSVG